MAQTQPLAANPFALMMTPEAVIEAVERSQRLSGLQRRICRPLDRPVLGRAEGEADEPVGTPALADVLAQRTER